MKKFNGRYVNIGLDQWCKKVERKHAGLSEQSVPSKPSDEVNDMLRKQAEELGLVNFDPTREDSKPKEPAEHPSLRAENFSGLRAVGKKRAYADAYDGFQQASSVNEPVDLSKYKSAKHLEEVGLERLKKCLQELGMKCGGTLTERAERLWLTRGVTDLSTLDSKLFSKKKKPKKNESSRGKKRRVEKGPLRQGDRRVPGQKKLPNSQRKRWKTVFKKPKEGVPRADHLGPIL
mmetsp:Transcript_28493/g.69491  ORF Transcript_28493/g.69491 Transcript_28493/m.69491 type:complete len:233 (-) Transcript_28493:156-854(-)